MARLTTSRSIMCGTLNALLAADILLYDSDMCQDEGFMALHLLNVRENCHSVDKGETYKGAEGCSFLHNTQPLPPT